jgi:hypothetical protein
MSTTVSAIRKLAIGSYEVELCSESEDEKLSFVFEVEGDEIQVVKSPDDFAEYMNLRLGEASTLFAAILAFHRAQELKMPPPV